MNCGPGLNSSMIIHSFVNRVSNLSSNTPFARLTRYMCRHSQYLVGVVSPRSLLALGSALLSNVVLSQHVTSLLHKLAHGGVLLAVLAAVTVAVG